MANEPKSKKAITDEPLDELLNGEDPKEAFLNGGLIDDLKQAIADPALIPRWTGTSSRRRNSRPVITATEPAASGF